MRKNRKKKPLCRVREIVVHCTGTHPNIRISQLDAMSYHYVITQSGKVLRLREVQPGDRRVEIAWLGGIDKIGRHRDNRTDAVSYSLFTTLVVLTDRYPHARIIPASEKYPFGFPNPGFNLLEWLADYIPRFLAA